MDIVRTAERVVVIEAVRAYVEQIGVIDMTDIGQLAGHLMSAEVLLMKVAAAFAEPAAT